MMLLGEGLGVLETDAVTDVEDVGEPPVEPVAVELCEGVPLLVGVVEPDGVLLGEPVCVRVCEGDAAAAPTGANATERKCVLAGATATTREVNVTVFQATTREAPDVYSTNWPPSSRPTSA